MHSWEDATQKYSDSASDSETSLARFSGKLEGPTLLAFQQYCRSAISSASSFRSQHTNTQLLFKTVDVQNFQCHHIKTAPESLTYGNISEALHGISGLSLVMCRFAGRANSEVRWYIPTMVLGYAIYCL